jgi:hypothetical protein
MEVELGGEGILERNTEECAIRRLTRIFDLRLT